MITNKIKKNPLMTQHWDNTLSRKHYYIIYRSKDNYYIELNIKVKR